MSGRRPSGIWNKERHDVSREPDEARSDYDQPGAGILEASRLLRQHKIRHLPVVRGGRLVGILTDRDLKRVSPSPATSLSVYEVNYLLDKLEATEVMIKQVVTVTPRTTIEKAGYPVLSAAV